MFATEAALALVTSRVVILHAHLFKNAGSTLDWSLRRCFGDAFCDHRGDAQMRGSPEYLRQYLLDHPHTKALSSHWLPLPPAVGELLSCIPLVLLRDPIERIASVYAFERRQEVDHPGTQRARSLGIRDYVRWRLEPRVGPVLKNYQTRMLSGIYPGSDDASQLEAAIANLGSFAAMGLVEHYDRSMVLAEETIRKHFPFVDLAYVRQNVTDREDHRSFPERRAALVDSLGDVYDAAIQANASDLQLYQQCARDFERRWSKLENAEQHLREFRERCEQLRLGEAQD